MSYTTAFSNKRTDMKIGEFHAQGDIIIERVADAKAGMPEPVDPDGAIVLARGEVTGHRHRFTGDSGVVMFRDDGLARELAPELYIGHVAVPEAGDNLLHEEHGTINLPPGTYRIRRQREHTAGMARVVAD
jgi:hypothetical protein